MIAILLTMGPTDRPAGDGAAAVAELARVAVERVVCVDGLAERALAKDDGGLSALLAGADACVIGCTRPRAARALLDFAGFDCRLQPITWLALPYDREALKREYGVPWYPVIDRSRCSGCGTCLDYCLFSVYASSGSQDASKRINVTAPLSCKTGCPACARLCPEGALLFPFCWEPELNGEIEEPVHRTRDALAAKLGDDPVRLLAERRLKKRLTDPDKFAQAEKDRVLFTGVL